jgi:hypothetical protein
MTRRLATILAAAALAVLWSARLLAQGRGEGAIVRRDNAPIYLKSSGSSIVDTRMRGDFLVGVTTMFTISSFQFEDENGRLHVSYFRDKDQKGMMRTGWMEPADLARFTYECGCGPRNKPCSPFSSQGFLVRWNTCFLEGKEKKLAELGSPGETRGALPAPAAANVANPAEKPLTNEDVIAMTKAALGDDIITAKIQQSNAAFDTSTEALIRLKKSGVSKGVMDAVLKRSSHVDATKTSVEPSSSGGNAVAAHGTVVEGKHLVLSGSGLRRKMTVAVYAGDLYLETATHDAAVVVGADQTKRLVLRILIDQIPKEQVVSTFTKGFKDHTRVASVLKEPIQEFVSWLEAVRSSDEIVMTYVPGTGTTLAVAGKTKGTIQGKEFAEALFTIWFGPDPVDDDFKKEILGES